MLNKENAALKQQVGELNSRIIGLTEEVQFAREEVHFACKDVIK